MPKMALDCVKKIPGITKNNKKNLNNSMELTKYENVKKTIKNYQKLSYGVSVTDACISWETTLELLQKINDTMEHAL